MFIKKKRKKFLNSCPKERENHRAQWWKDEGQGKQGRGEKQGVMGKRGAQRDAERKGWGEAGVQRGMKGSTERGGSSQATWEEGQASEGSRPHTLKSSPETDRPECKSWYVSNSFWNLCLALYARMVPSPRREDAKWENTGLCAGEAETDTQQRKSGRLDARKPTASRGLWSHVLTKGTPRASWRAAWGRKLPLLERIFHVTLKLLFMPTFTLTTWKLKILFELTFDQIQIEARFR